MVPIQHICGIGAVLAGLAGWPVPWCSSASRPRSAPCHRRCGALVWQISLITVGAALRVLRTGTPVHVLPYIGRWDVLSQAPNVVQPRW
jgi:hypothetical protein